MVHPAAFAIALGIGLGVAIFVYANRRNSYQYRSQPSNLSIDPLDLMREKFTSDICSICLEPFDKTVIQLECAHRFHKKCMDGWIQYNKNCPNCRGPAKIPT